MSNLDRVMSPIETANGLPNEHYVSDDVFLRERDAVLFASWAGVGFAKDIPNPGDAVPLTFLGMPLLLLRDKAGVVRVFQNTCRHRGMILVEEPRNIGGAIRCPYHSWCYATTGELVATPHVGGPGQNSHDGIDKSTLGLIEIRSHVWRDVIFVNVNGDAPAFENYASTVIARWAEFEEQPLYHSGTDSSFKLDVGCNWKLAVENYCESYHLPWIHPGLNSYSRLEDHYHIEEPGAFSGQGTVVYSPMMADDGQRFPEFKGLSKKWDAGAEYIALYPNVLFGVHRDHAFAMVLEPRGKDRTVEHTEIYYADDAANGPEWAEMRGRNTAMWREVFEEDVFVVEGMQRGRLGVHFDGGRFSPAMDGPTHLFHHWVADCLSDKRFAGA